MQFNRENDSLSLFTNYEGLKAIHGITEDRTQTVAFEFIRNQ